MAENSPITRRSFLAGGLLAIPFAIASQKFSSFSNKDGTFTSEYILDLSSLEFLKGLSGDQMVSKITHTLIDSKKIGLDWFEKCGAIQADYLAKGLLISSSRSVSPSGAELTFVTVWKNQQSFLSFFNETEFYRLDYAYIAAGLAPKMAKSYAVFPSSAEEYLRMQKKLKQV
jgi:hypothetical protein